MAKPPPPFHYQKQFPVGKDRTEYRLLTDEFVETVDFQGEQVLKVDPKGLTYLAQTAMKEISFKLRTEHLEKVAAILDDPEATENDRTIAMTMLRNAEVAAHGVLPFCQDTGTAIILGKKGQKVWTGGGDEAALSQGVYNTYTQENLRYSQTVPLSMYEEKNTGCNLPAQIDILATDADSYDFLFVAKGGGSANKTFLFQETKALLNPANLEKFCIEKMGTLGTSACPPYHIAIVIGGTSAETTMKTVKLASTKYYDELPTEGNEHGQAFRDLELEAKLLNYTRKMGYGAQFGGKYFALDIRVIRLPRHGASCPVGIGVSCSADRNAKGRIDKDGIWFEKLEDNPGRFIPEAAEVSKPKEAVKIDLNRPMADILAELTQYPVATPLSLTGTIVVARDIAHAKLKERIDQGEGMPEYFKNHPVYYAGPAKTPAGKPSGSFGPTTAGRMDSYVQPFQAEGGSMIMLAKGNRSQQVTDACQEYGGFYLGSIGGPAALLAEHNIKNVEVLEYPELGMEAIWKIEVEDFPAYILVDDKGNDFFADVRDSCAKCALEAYETARAEMVAK
ncbi:fumarate hydratase [Coraliomargarita akajimensis]|uniref:Fumarate hydratase class I n=1 Tax=Coraliomargarita akajimensis (strain DSM 45221 / IAM 15411 / JCM 23193 / KCTC 12865 / 04OKA010-24) TaxID=583355 RepID=D5EIE9_CORAD|nr:fumarate hydratase [Coraliomargarita akajimensis]ADE54215.1 hydro-lyase, Fe-S type, tartrate/fumarate subfamily, beta subunit [Coraliomargarita akajimensis DSM 45221]